MTPEPSILLTSPIPQVFSPSQMAFGVHCLLRVVLGASRDLPILSSHPAGAIGRAFHKLVELAVQGRIERSESPDADAARTLDRLLDEEEAALSNRLATPVALRTVFPPAIWRRKRRTALDLANSYLSGAVPRITRVGAGQVLSANELPATGRWSEVRLEVPELRLAGRVDVVERKPGKVTIRDIKTGRVETDAGELLRHVEDQLRLYGLMARRIWPDSEVELIVDHGRERQIPFGFDDEHRLTTWLESAFQQLPEGNADAAGLATLGDACDGCPHRHICPTYRAGVPALWRTDSAFRLPLDTWGRLTDVLYGPGGQCDLTLLDDAGRTVKVFGVVATRMTAATGGQWVSLFGLRSKDRRGGGDRWRHPQNFFEVADDDPFARAWALEVFGRAEEMGHPLA